MFDEEIRTDFLKKYASFILQNYLEEITELFYSKIKNGSFLNIDLILYRQEFFVVLRNEVKEYLLKIIEDEIDHDVIMVSSKLEYSKVFGLAVKEFNVEGIGLLFYYWNSSLFHFLKKYSEDINDILEVINQIEKLSKAYELKLISLFFELRCSVKTEILPIKEKVKEQVDKSKDVYPGAEPSIHAGYWQINFENRLIKFSDEFLQLFRLPRNKKFTLDFLKDILIEGKDYLHFLERSDIEIEEGREFYSFEFKLRLPNGKIREFISKDHPIRNSNEKLIGLSSFIQDITETKQGSRNINESSMPFHKILQYSPTHINIYDVEEDKLIYSNNKGRNLFGHTSIMLLESRFTNLMKRITHPDDKEKVLNRIINLPSLKDDEFDQIEYRMIDVEGNILWFYSRGSVFKRVNGKVKQVLLNAVNITEVKKAEEELKFLTERLNEAQRIGHVGSYDWDIVMDVLIYSEEAYRIYNFPLEKKQFKIEDLKALIRKDNISMFEENLRRALEDGLEYEGTYKIILPDKTEKDVISRARIFRDPNGKPVKMLGTVLDVTSIKKVENELREKNIQIEQANIKLEESEKEVKRINAELEDRIKIRTFELQKSDERYRAFIKNSTEGIYCYELEEIPYIDINLPLNTQIDLIYKHAIFAECNNKFAQLYGYNSAEEIIGKKMAMIFPLSAPGTMEVTKNFVLSGYRRTDLDSRMTIKDGSEIVIRRNLIGIVEGNKFIRAWGTQKDITERVHAIDALVASEERYRFLVESIPMIFWTARPDGGIDFLNKKWIEYTGSTLEEFQNLGWLPFVHSDDVPAILQASKDSSKIGKIYEVECRLKSANQEFKWHLMRAIPYKDKVGNIIKWMGTATDVDEHKKYSEELKQKNELLTKINKDLDNFIYTASHDLKTPISNIEGLLSTLNTEMSEHCKAEGDVGEILLLMENSVNKFKKTIFDLTEITKAQKSGEEEIQNNNIREIFDEVKTILSDLIKISEADIKTDFKDCSTIKFSSRNLKSILYNLLSNAIKYRSPNRKPLVNIKTECIDDYILLSVQDNGLGLDKSQIPKVFGMFKRLHANIEGSGVGLYIVKRIITNAGGKIEVDSEKGVGSIFKVYFKKEY